MERSKFLWIIFLVIFSVTNCDDFVEEEIVDYGDDGETTIIPITTKAPTSTTPASSELSTSTMNNLEQEHSHEMNVNQTLSIFSLKNIESKFNDLIIKLDHEQIMYLNDTQNSSKILEQKYKSDVKIYNQTIASVFEDFKKNFEEYKKVKNEVEEKMLKIRENYFRETLTIEMYWMNDQINFYKEHDKLIISKQNYITLEKIYQSSTSPENTENLIKIKNNFDEIDQKMKNNSVLLQEKNQNYLNLTNQAELKMTIELLKLLNDTKYDAVIKNFNDLLKVKKTIENLVKYCSNYLAMSNNLLTDLTKNLSSLSSELVLSKIMPSDNEIVQISSNSSEASLTKISKSSDMTNYKWVQSYQGNAQLSENAVVGGQDVDGVIFYVARIKDYKSYLYGKFAFSKGRKHAYFPYEYVEHGVEKFEVNLLPFIKRQNKSSFLFIIKFICYSLTQILTSPNYIWCEFDKTKTYDDLPICRAVHNSSVIPGTLEKNGVCRVGHNYKIHRYSNGDFKVLRIGGC